MIYIFVFIISHVSNIVLCLPCILNAEFCANKHLQMYHSIVTSHPIEALRVVLFIV